MVERIAGLAMSVVLLPLVSGAQPPQASDVEAVRPFEISVSDARAMYF